jgi:hypothetical protein
MFFYLLICEAIVLVTADFWYYPSFLDSSAYRLFFLPFS